MVQIETGVPIPVGVRRSYPYREMSVGDSFWVEGIGLQVVMNTNYRWGKRLGRKFIARTDGPGVRVWRVD